MFYFLMSSCLFLIYFQLSQYFPKSNQTNKNLLDLSAVCYQVVIYVLFGVSGNQPIQSVRYGDVLEGTEQLV